MCYIQWHNVRDKIGMPVCVLFKGYVGQGENRWLYVCVWWFVCGFMFNPDLGN